MNSMKMIQKTLMKQVKSITNLEIVISIILVIVYFFNIRLPSELSPFIASPAGIIVLILSALASFIYIHPFVGIISIFVLHNFLYNAKVDMQKTSGISSGTAGSRFTQVTNQSIVNPALTTPMSPSVAALATNTSSGAALASGHFSETFVDTNPFSSSSSSLDYGSSTTIPITQHDLLEVDIVSNSAPIGMTNDPNKSIKSSYAPLGIDQNNPTPSLDMFVTK